MNSHPILNCTPQAPPGKIYQKWLLVPAHAWQVIIVASTLDQLDVFEKVIYELMRSGDYDVEQLATYTRLHTDLVKILLERLHGHGLLEKTGDQRYRALKSNNHGSSAPVDPSTQTVGWVIQHPWTGRLFPAFLPRLPVQSTVDVNPASGLKRLLFGDDSKQYSQEAEALDFPAHRGINPAPKDVTRLFELRRSGEFRERISGLRRISPDDGTFQKFDYKKSVRKVKFLSSDPILVYLATAGVVFKEAQAEWHVCCPVGTGLSQELRDLVLRNSEIGDSAAERFVSGICKHTCLGNIYDWTRANQDYQAHARRETVSTFGSAILDYPDLLDQLDAFHDLWVRLRGTEGDPPIHYVKAVCAVARQLIEALFKEFVKLRPLTNLDIYLTGKNEVEHTQFVLEWLGQVGYATGGIEDLFVVSKSWLKKSAGDSGTYYMLKNVIGALALQGWVQADHPLRIATNRNREFFIHLKRVIVLGNASSHDNSHQAEHGLELSKETALSIRAPLSQIVRHLLDPQGTIFKPNLI